MPRNAAVSVGYLWGGPATRTCGIFVGLAGGLRRLTQLGIFSALVLTSRRTCGHGRALVGTIECYAWCLGGWSAAMSRLVSRLRAGSAQDSA